MPNKTDLSAYQVDISSTLPVAEANIQKRIGGKTWPKPKSVEEKQSKTVSLTFTPSEYEIIESKKWLAQSATYLRHLLIEKSKLFDID